MAGCATLPTARYARPDEARLMITGYWHNWQSKKTGWLPLREVPQDYDRVIIAFALPAEPWNGTMEFTPDQGTPDEFRQAVAMLQGRGQEVLLSVGGGKHPIEIKSPKQRERFVASLRQLIDFYGFDGVDMNLEKQSLVLDADDTDFRYPVTPKVVHLIVALKELSSHPGFVLTFAPETVYSTGGYHRYGEGFGGYLAIFHALRHRLDAVHLQLYNSGSQFVYRGAGKEDQIVEQGSVAFVTGLTEMLADGFPVGRDSNRFFEGLGSERVFPGLPAHPDSAPGGGYLPPDQLCRALRELPEVGGVMFWSINWDRLAPDGESVYPMMRAMLKCEQRLFSSN